MQKSDVIVQSAIGAIVTIPRIFNIVVSCGTDLGYVVFRILGLWNEGGLAVSLLRFIGLNGANIIKFNGCCHFRRRRESSWVEGFGSEAVAAARSSVR